MYLFFRLQILFVLLSVTIISNAKTHTLFKSGKTDYVILISNNASVSEMYAASELQYWLKEISGITFPIVNDSHSPRGKKIIVGYNPKYLKSLKIQKPDDTDQGFVYGNNGDDIFIFGGSNIGTLYGVYSFLENELSCRWYTKDVALAPKKEKWSFSELYDKETPAFDYRNVLYYDAYDVEWSHRNKTNGRINSKKTKFGTFYSTNFAIWGTHTFKILLPPEQFFDSHPEFFSLRDGRRTIDQLCLTNPMVLRLCKEKLREIMRTNPNYRIFSVTQNDNLKTCQCNKCKEFTNKYGGESGLMIWFVNQIATSLESEFPDKYILTFAYSYTRNAPQNIVPKNNIIIRLCSDNCCESHPINLCNNNVSFIKDLSQWSNLTSNIFIWDYVVSFKQYLLPFPNIRILQSNIQTYRKYGIRGTMNEGVYNTTGGDFSELRAYLLAKLLWNPDINVDTVIDDFMRGYYQSSSYYMKLYFDKVQSLASDNDHITHVVTDRNKVYSSDFIKTSMSLLEKAEISANSQDVLERVQRQKMVIAYIHCKKNPELALQDGSYDLVMTMTKKIGIKKFAESGNNKSIDEFVSKMENVKKSIENKYSKEYLEYKLSKFLENILK